MNQNLKNLLPHEISDETAYHLTNFVMELALTLDEIYFEQSLRYHRSVTRPQHYTSLYGNYKNDENPF